MQPSIGRLIKKIALAGESYIGSRLENMGIGRGQFHILMAIIKHGAETQAEIADILGTDKSSVARTIMKLVDDGIIERHRQEENRRAYRIRLTQKGENLKKELSQLLTSWTDKITQGMDEAERKQLYSYLEKIYENVKDVE